MAAERAARIGRRIRELREERELTQAQLAAALNEPSVTSTYISRWERGEHEPLGDRLDLIAEVLNTTTADLMAGSVEERQEPGDTPDPFTADAKQLDRIEEQLRKVLETLKEGGDSEDDASGDVPGFGPP